LVSLLRLIYKVFPASRSRLPAQFGGAFSIFYKAGHLYGGGSLRRYGQPRPHLRFHLPNADSSRFRDHGCSLGVIYSFTLIGSIRIAPPIGEAIEVT
jgi:hypothetical protein